MTREDLIDEAVRRVMSTVGFSYLRDYPGRPGAIPEIRRRRGGEWAWFYEPVICTEFARIQREYAI